MMNSFMTKLAFINDLVGIIEGPDQEWRDRVRRVGVRDAWVDGEAHLGGCRNGLIESLVDEDFPRGWVIGQH